MSNKNPEQFNTESPTIHIMMRFGVGWGGSVNVSAIGRPLEKECLQKETC